MLSVSLSSNATVSQADRNSWLEMVNSIKNPPRCVEVGSSSDSLVFST